MAIDLAKRTEKVTISLKKRGILTAPTVRVGLAFDKSGSTEHLYSSGVMSETNDRLLAVANRFDDNGEMDMWSFTTRAFRLKPANEASYGNYVKRHILQNPNIDQSGGTKYAPVIEDMERFYFGEPTLSVAKDIVGLFQGLFKKTPEKVEKLNSTALPAFCIIVTDGTNSDRAETATVLRRAAKLPIYWLFVGVGDECEFEFIQEMGEELPNVGFVNLHSLDISDENLYEKVITEEFCEWVKNF